MDLSFVPKKDNKTSKTKKTRSFDPDKISIITDEPFTSAPDLDEYSKTLSSIAINSPLDLHSPESWDKWKASKSQL